MKMQENLSEQDMANPTFEVRGNYYKDKCFPGLNDMLREAERHPQAYARMKRDFEYVAISSIRRDLRGYKAEGRVFLNYTFGEPNSGQKRDYDNIVAAGRKIITDALVKCKVIQDDSPKYLGYGENHFEYVSKPFIRVEIEVENPSVMEKET